MGVAALISATGRSAEAPGGARLAEVIVLGVLCLGLLAAIADRYADRETIGMVFILGMNAGHIAMHQPAADVDDQVAVALVVLLQHRVSLQARRQCAASRS